MVARWVMPGLLVAGAIDVVVLDALVAPRALATAEVSRGEARVRPGGEAPARAQVVHEGVAPRQAAVASALVAPSRAVAPSPVPPAAPSVAPPTAVASPPASTAVLADAHAGSGDPAAPPSAPAPDAPAAPPDAPAAPGEPALTLFYATDHASLSPADQAALDAVIARLVEEPRARVVITGRADPRGSDRYNAYLSSRRARKVARYLVDHGVDEARVERRALGALEVDVADPAALRRARRVDIAVVEAPP